MAPHGELAKAIVGEAIKVWLPGESPWAECLAVHEDGTWDGRIINKLFAEYSEHERARFMKDHFGKVARIPQLHSFKQDQIVRFRRDVTPDCELWVPSFPNGERHGP